jgi:hypothetical protein
LVVPLATEGLTGVTAIDVSDAAVTVRVLDLDMPPNVAVIVVDPAATAVTNPLEPTALLIVATVRSDELQVTAVVRSCVVSSK